MVFLTLAALGTGAKELFDYNRQNYKFDRKQRLEQECLRIDLQLKRFELFREDIRDLVKLTIDRMDVYHLVGALFLQFCIVILTKGRVQASAPPFLLSLFLLTSVCAFIYLLLAVWMSMHASIASHSFGVRLLTRFVRLPIPSMRQIRDLTFKYADFEKHGVAKLLEVPFAKQVVSMAPHDNAGSAPDALEACPGKDAAALSQDDVDVLPQDVRGYLSTAGGPGGGPPRAGLPGRSTAAAPGVATCAEPGPSSCLTGPELAAQGQHGTTTSVAAEPTLGRPFRVRQTTCDAEVDAAHMLPDEAEAPLFSGSSGALPERHVQLFRQLQSKWQCYDAYCRVCMGLGVNQMLQVLSYYSICHTIVENNSPTTGFAMVTLFQCTTVAVGVLDLAGLKSREIIAVQIVGMLPCFLTARSLARGTRNAYGLLDPDDDYPASPLSFLFTVCWLELWLRVSAPSGGDQARLPRRFRQVLFLDVFGDSMGLDGEDSEEDDASKDGTPGASRALACRELRDAVARAGRLLGLARLAVRRWRAAPQWALSGAQRRELRALQEQLARWGSALQAEVERHRAEQGLAEVLRLVCEDELRQPDDAAPTDDPFARCLLGPFKHEGVAACYHYDPESQQTIFDDDASKVRPDALVLQLGAVAAIIKDLENEVRGLLEVRIMRDLRAETRRQRKCRRDRDLKNPLAAPTTTAAASFPNLVSLVQGHVNSWKDARTTGARFRHRRLPTSEGSPRPAGRAVEAVEAVGPGPLSPGRPPTEEETMPAEDQTLVAVAGEHARHFVPERLPWLLVRGMTRVLQLCWLWACGMAILREVDLYRIDFGVQILSQHSESEPRRLCASEIGDSESLEVIWPHGSFFRPRGLFCPADGQGRLLVSSPFALYEMDARIFERPLRLRELQRGRLSSTTVVLCGPWVRGATGAAPGAARRLGGARCVTPWVAGDGELHWPAGPGLGRRASAGSGAGAVPAAARLGGAAWRVASGAVVPCGNVSRLLPAAAAAAEWCLLLAGWDGASVPVAAVPLPAEPGRLAGTSAHVMPTLNAPLKPSGAKHDVVSLHVEPRRGRLMALLASGHVEAWDLFTLSSLGRWKPKWPPGSAEGVRPLSFCEDSGQWLFVLGHSTAADLTLVRLQLPELFQHSVSRAE